jgi:hypothetical protein
MKKRTLSEVKFAADIFVSKTKRLANKINVKWLITDLTIGALLIGVFALPEFNANAKESTINKYEISVFNAGNNVLADESQTNDHEIEYIKLDRAENLRVFFRKYNSVLEHEAEVFVEVADEYGLDYRLLPAIAGIESTFCKQIIPGTYNCYGWGIYGNNVIWFESYEDGIRKVAKGIHEGYVLRGADTPEKMAPIYTPPNHVKWLNSVRFFMNQIG